jgi:hypothetical protein
LRLGNPYRKKAEKSRDYNVYLGALRAEQDKGVGLS